MFSKKRNAKKAPQVTENTVTIETGVTAVAVEMSVNPGVHAQGDVVNNPATLESTITEPAPQMAHKPSVSRYSSDTEPHFIHNDANLAAWNTNMMKRYIVLLIATVPFGLYTYFPSATLDPTISLLLGIVPMCTVLWQNKWGGRSPHCSLTPPPLMWKEFDSVVFRAIKGLNPRWFWMYWALTPIVGILCTVISAFYIEAGHPHATRTFRSVNVGVFVWYASACVASIGANANVSVYQESKWEDAKAAFAASHSAPNLAETFERFAREKAEKQAQSATVKVCAVIMSLLPAVVAAIRTSNHMAEFDPGGVAVIMAMACWFCIFMVCWGLFQWALIALMEQYLFCSNIATLLATCTQSWDAMAIGLPYIPLTSVSNVLKWYELRQIFITVRFDHCYGVCGMSVSIMCAFSLLNLLYSVVIVLAFNQPLFSVENTFISICAFEVSAMLLVLLMRVATIYTKQQKHLPFLEEARFKAVFSAAKSTPGSNTQNVTGLLDATEKRIKDEAHCPHVMGISVRPTFFYFVVGYAAAAVIAIIGKKAMSGFS